ncbi:hypothetical protein A2853_00940 [Candidatus Kaiserbacteria bacterium RIFCSPHIGHO2_01_FULL_55_17]|uniref:Uncharacterized protein n=1 Tax=Candidatus Kaiserbacteria bacterium RIFCSPHIGHO2_01_FULL_55_17 TaxID=1798484 RepID=A0A1F6D9C5_9BACT|nr:MAG: hypothetical protein A2853_00940 [Candidatus Kaiserbacteria bacterium RIFCSPHIGHO2_01_FULL_55_17]
MEQYRSIIRATAFALGVVPLNASALTLPQVVGLFHIVVGFLLTFTVLIFVVGFSVYVARFNTWPSHRDAAIRGLEWAVTMLFVLLVVLAIINAIQNHGAIALPILAFVVIVAVAVLIIRMAGSGAKKPPPANARGRRP